MKIIQICPHFPPNLGGVQIVAKEISENLSKKGHNVEVFTSNIGCEKGKLKSTKNLKIHYLKAWEFAHTPIMLSLFFKLMKVPKDSIMHVHTGSPLVPEIVYLISKFRGIPYIAHFHGNAEPSGKMGFLLPIYQKFFLKIVLINASKVICLTEDDQNLMNNKYRIKRERIAIIPNGVSKIFFVKKERSKLNRPYRLLFVGRFVKQKNLPRLINAFSLLKEKAVLYLVGDGEEREKVKEMVSKKDINNVIFCGEKKGKDLIEIYKFADAFVLTSDYEGLSLTLLEALATRTPVIASDIPGTRKVIKNKYNGLLVEPTPEKIAKAIDSLIKNPKLREKLAKNGLKKVKKYSWNKVIEQTEQVYKEALEDYANKK